MGKRKKHKPIVICGARQVGKTWIVEHFGKSEFKNYIKINFELEPKFKSCFSTLDPEQIILNIELTANINIEPGATLLFLDEIQECPNALKSLRYFYENLPELHVISAGSLLEFIMQMDKISIPVGRVINFHMLPLSFGEFLSACKQDKLRNYLKNLTINDNIPEHVHKNCISLLRK